MGPQVLFCPASFTFRATAQTAIVTWDIPIFKDNSLGYIEPECNRQSGETFYWGDWNIYCRAYDNNPTNEPAVCHFVVTVKRKCHNRLNVFGCLQRNVELNNFNFLTLHLNKAKIIVKR